MMRLAEYVGPVDTRDGVSFPGVMHQVERGAVQQPEASAWSLAKLAEYVAASRSTPTGRGGGLRSGPTT